MSLLFSPYTIRHITFRNRIALAPMVQEKGDADGCVTDFLLEHYGERAAAGTGLIIVEATAVEPAGRCWPGGLCAFAPQHLPGLRRLAERIHAEGAVAAIQLVHGGPQARPAVSGLESVGPSDVRPKHDLTIPRALTIPEILAIEGRFADAAALALEAGFDAIEIHGAHGYLLDSFLMAKRNLREDEYGGTLEKRMRLLVETCQQVRRRIGPRPLLWSRVCAFNKQFEQFSPRDLGVLLAGLEGAGLDMVHLSTEDGLLGYFDSAKPLGKWAGEMTRLPRIVAGHLGDPPDAERCLAEGISEFVAIGSYMLNNPTWTRKAHQKLDGQPAPTIPTGPAA